MSCGGENTKSMTEFLHSMPEGQENCSNKDIGELLGVYTRLLGHLEDLFLILCKKLFHLNDSDVDKAIRHCDAIDDLWRYLKMSVTPKLHLLSFHLSRFLERIQGFVNLGEDAGERAHQEEARN